MTPSPSESPPSAQATPLDEAQFPRGHCRYILMTPGLKGQRCACVSFIHNKGVPGASCDCGHLSCFHVAAMEPPSSGAQKNEFELLKQRVQLLEEPAEWAAHGELGPVSQRVRQLEETVEKHREEVQADIKGAYRSVSGAWQLVEQLQKRIAAFEEIFRMHSDQLAKAGKELQDLRNRHLELIDSDESLEERIEKLECVTTTLPPHVTRSDADSAIDTSNETTSSDQKSLPRRFSIDKIKASVPSADGTPNTIVVEQESVFETPLFPRQHSGSWTVHVSLLPSRQQSSPFEKDSTPYKRCLSRGLHRMVAIEGSEGSSFVKAVSRAFHDVLQGRPWEPLELQAGNGDRAEMIRLKPIDVEVWDVNFLRKRCAVCDKNGRPEFLYIAPRAGQLTWASLKQAPVHVEGLESSWSYEQPLDGEDASEEDVSETLMPPPVSSTASPASSLKRSISEISLSTRSSTSSATSQEYLSPRSKMARTCMSEMMEIPKGISAGL